MLSIISIDCLEAILSFLDSQHIGSLWLSNDLLLRQRLSHTVTKLDVSLRPWLPLVWPRFVSSLPKLKMLHVTIYQGEHLSIPADRPIPGLCWSELPKGLVSLAVNVHFFDLPFLINSKLPHLHDLKIHSETLHSTFPDLACWTPNLKTLEWKEKAKRISLDVSLLPPGLTSLTVCLDKVKMSGKPWPPALTKLDLEIKFSDYWFSKLPSSLTDLTLVYSSYSKSDWTHLPNLLHVQGALAVPALSMLPRSLLSVGGVRNICSLPPHLTSLKIPLNFLEFGLKDAAALPRSLTSISGPYLLLSRDSITELLPLIPPHMQYSASLQNKGPPLPIELNAHKQLTRLKMNRIRDKEDIMKLPATLLHFTCPPLNRHQILHLPSTLQSLTIDVDDSMSSLFFALLPRGLSKLVLTRDWDDIDECLPHALSSSTHLPRSLTELSLPICIIEEESWFSGLPDTLTSLDIQELRKTNSGVFSGPLPAGLTALTLPLSLKLPAIYHLELLKCLPRHLIYLDMIHGDSVRYYEFSDDYDATEFRNEDMALLPRGLLMAHFPPSSELDSGCLQTLPPMMVDFRVGLHQQILSIWRSGKEI